MNDWRAVCAKRRTYSSEGGQWKRAEMTVPRQRPTQRTIHHLRELTYLEEQYAQAWATELKDLLREMKAATDQARAAGTLRLSQQERDRFVARYEQILAVGHAANPP